MFYYGFFFTKITQVYKGHNSLFSTNIRNGYSMQVLSQDFALVFLIFASHKEGFSWFLSLYGPQGF